MRARLFVCSLAGFACQSAGVVHPATVEPRFHWEDPGLFETFLPGGAELQLRVEARVALGEGRAFVLEYGRRRVRASETSERCPTDQPLDIVRWRGRLVWLRADKYGNLQLDADLGAGAEPFARPDDARDLRGKSGGFPVQAPAPRLAADGELLVLFAAPWIHRYEHGEWRSVRLDLGRDELIHAPGRALLVGRTLYLGVDKGEWGGQLIAADVDTGSGRNVCRDWPRGPWNVRDLDRGPDGALYVTCGISHMGRESSALIVGDGVSWRCAAWSDVDDDPSVHPQDSGEQRIARVRAAAEGAVDRTRLPSAALAALAFDDEQRPCLLSDRLGLFRRERSGAWTWLTPGWPDSLVYVQDLAFVEGRAVITSSTAGVLVVDLETLAVERVRLE